MGRYRKKPIIIEAFQYFSNMGTYTEKIPRWFIAACMSGIVYSDGDIDFIKTPDGFHTISDGDWIIREIEGELDLCKPDIFKATYEEIPDDEDIEGVTK